MYDGSGQQICTPFLIAELFCHFLGGVIPYLVPGLHGELSSSFSSSAIGIPRRAWLLLFAKLTWRALLCTAGILPT